MSCGKEFQSHGAIQLKALHPTGGWWNIFFRETDAEFCFFICFFFLLDPTKESRGAIKFMNCVATLRTKSKTRFFIEYHSSCLESKNNLLDRKPVCYWVDILETFLKKTLFIEFVKSPEIDNQESTEGSIKVRFTAHVEVICFGLFMIYVELNPGTL